MSALEDAAEDAVHALLPVLPLQGSAGTGYVATPAHHTAVVAERHEWTDAADAVARLHQELRHAQLDRAGNQDRDPDWRQ